MEMIRLNQKEVDHIVKEMAPAGLANHMHLVKMNVEETKCGIYEN